MRPHIIETTDLTESLASVAQPPDALSMSKR
jgi:hypothetical protein